MKTGLIAMQEIRVGLRNRWVLATTLLLAALALSLVLLGSAPTGTVKADPLAVVITGAAVTFPRTGQVVGDVALQGSTQADVALRGSVASVGIIGSSVSGVSFSGSLLNRS